jgi:ligand-binding sensor domain-containing protein
LHFENALLKGPLKSPDDKAISAITAFNNGFVLGCDDGILRVYEEGKDAQSDQ